MGLGRIPVGSDHFPMGLKRTPVGLESFPVGKWAVMGRGSAQMRTKMESGCRGGDGIAVPLFDVGGEAVNGGAFIQECAVGREDPSRASRTID